MEGIMDIRPAGAIALVEHELRGRVLFLKHGSQRLPGVIVERNVALLVILHVEQEMGLVPHAKDPAFPVDVRELQEQQFRPAQSCVAR
jgi:hypothetical protein